MKEMFNKLMPIRAMPVRLRMLYEKVGVFVSLASIQVVGQVDLDTEIETINLLTEEGSTSKNNIYVCEYSADLVIPSQHYESNIIIVTKEEEIPKIPGLENYLIIYSENRFENVYNALLNAVLLAKNTNYIFYEKHIENNQIQELILLGERLLTNPFILFNKYFGLEGYSKNRKSNEPIYNDTIKLGELEYKYLALIMAGDIFKTLCRKGEVLLPDNNPICKKPIYIKELSDGDDIVGYGFLICENTIPMKEMLSYFSVFINNFTYFLLESVANRTSFQELRGLFLTKLLDVGMSRDELLLRSKDVNIEVEKNFFYAQVAFQDNRAILKDFIIKTISTYSPHYISFKYNDNLQLIMYLDSQSKVDKISRELNVLVKDFNIRTGISQQHKDLGELRSAYEQSTVALAHGLKINQVNPRKLFFEYSFGVFNYCDFIQFDMLHLYYRNYGSLPEEFAALNEMITMDHQDINNNRDYRNTDSNIVFRFLKNQMRINETAKESYMHRNSLVYRINKIEEKLGVALEDKKIRRRILLTFLISDYKKTYLRN